MKKILWLHSDRFACGVYRAFVPALSFQDRRIAESAFLLHEQMVEEENLSALDGTDIVVFQRAVFPYAEKWMEECAKRGITTVLETDDDLFNIPKLNPAGWYWNKKDVRKRLKRQLEMATTITVSTPPLKKEIERSMGWSATSKIHVCANHLHPDVWGEAVWGHVTPYPNTIPQTGERYRVIGWQGSRTHDQDFTVVLPVLKQILKEHPDVQVRLFGCVPQTLRGVIGGDRFQFTKGVLFERYPATLRYMAFDIGIAPVEGNRFNRSKSNIKWLEYAALGIPCVASKVGPYEASIADGIDGYLATTAEDWYVALTRLLDRPELRRDIGETARGTVWHTYGPDRARQWAVAFGLEEAWSRSSPTVTASERVA